MLMTKLLHMSKCLWWNYLLSTIDSSQTPPKHEKEDDRSSSVDLSLFNTKDDKPSSDSDDCCHHIEKVSTII
jgi:hypothetical protein